MTKVRAGLVLVACKHCRENLEKVVEEKDKVEKYCIIAIKMYDCLRKSTSSDVDRFLHRSEQKKLTETFFCPIFASK